MTAIRASVPVLIPPLRLAGDLRAPDDAKGLVIFAHGGGSSRFSPRNQEVARALNEAGLATLLLDLLTEDEARNRANVFDIDLLAERLTQAIDWARAKPALAALPIGLFGGGRGGRPDLAEAALDQVAAPTC